MRLFILIFLLINSYAQDIQKAQIYNKTKHSIDNWYMSEKLDGIRAYWNGKYFLSKNGNIINAPKWFTKKFPKFELDGELWTKRNDFENIQNIVLDKIPSEKWSQITYNVFEVPNTKGNFDLRLKRIKDFLKTEPNKFINVIPQIKCQNQKHLESYLDELIEKKAEGVMLKNPKLEYFTGRNENILKVKKFYDDEGVVIGLNYENKKFKSLILKLKNGVIFNLGGGFTNKERKNPPKIGDIVTFKYYSLTKNNKPKFASYLRIRKKE
uniref:DNA ligase n=1 Tax=Aliarcobacter sp. TaxID=2321116 RepID=UPI0040479F16